MASGLIIRNGFALDNFTTQANSSSYALSYDPITGQIGYMTTSSFTIGVINNSQTSSFVTNNQTGSFATTGSNQFNGNQSISGSLTLSQNLTVLGTASFQYVTTVYETASVIYSSGSNQFGDATNDIQTLIGTTNVSGALNVTASGITFNIPSKANGYVLKSDATGGATWVDPITLPATIASYIGTTNITASVSTSTGSLFAITSGSDTLLRMTDSGTLVLPSYNSTTGPVRYAFLSSGSTNTGLKFWNHNLWIFQVDGGDKFKISSTAVEVTSGRINMSAQAAAPYIEQGLDIGTSYNNLKLVAGGLNQSGSIQLLNGNVLITQNHYGSGSNYKLQISGSGVSGPFNANDILLVSGSNTFIKSLTNTTQNNIVGYNTATGQLYYFPTSSIIANVFPYNGNAVISGSLTVTGSISVSSSLMINDSLSEYNKNLSLSSGVTTVFQRDTGSYTSAIAKYTVNKSTSARSGQFMIVWNGNTINDVDISTGDIGNTDDIVLQSGLVAGQIQTNVSASSAGWAIKMLITYL